MKRSVAAHRRKGALFIASLLGFLVLGQMPLDALAPKGSRERKFQRGLLNLTFAPVELTHALSEKRSRGEELPPSWLTNGVARGTYLMFCRLLSGISDIVTSPFSRLNHPEPTMDPEFALNHLDLLKGNEG